ncbi:Beta-ketoacyl synthase, C-terminal domain, partial [Chitinophaga eiseniae]
MTQHKLSDAKKYTGLEVAVVGMSGRFPGAPDLAAFWDNLRHGVESVCFFSEEELIADGRNPDVVRRPDYVGANAYMGDKEYFDAPFFNYRPDEAALMDPQIRLFHECVWNAIEDAGYDPNSPSFKAGLFAGASCNVNWELYAQLVNREGLVDEYSASLLRNANFMATMTSYALNLRGPSVFMDTACSTSLVAIHMACKSLLMGECNVAIAGGASVKNRSKEGYIYQEGMITSRDGHCRAFDEASSGTVAGDGVGVVVLKTLKNALLDKDHIYAIIKGTGINNDGSTKVGYTAPSIDGQTEAILMAQKWAGVAPDSISFVETHGTGTHLGDPIEIEALRRVFGNSSRQYCALG